jgi:hypothetical protein
MINEYVSLNTETSYINSRWVVVFATLGSSMSNSYVWLKRVTFGWDTKDNLQIYADGLNGKIPVNYTGKVGTIGEYTVAKLADVTAFTRGHDLPFNTANIPIG